MHARDDRGGALSAERQAGSVPSAGRVTYAPIRGGGSLVAPSASANEAACGGEFPNDPAFARAEVDPSVPYATRPRPFSNELGALARVLARLGVRLAFFAPDGWRTAATTVEKAMRSDAYLEVTPVGDMTTAAARRIPVLHYAKCVTSRAAWSYAGTAPRRGSPCKWQCAPPRCSDASNTVIGASLASASRGACVIFPNATIG